MATEETTILTSLIAGSFAGLFADMILFPLDTLKTRLQSSEGFRKSGGFKGVYQGIGSAALGSVPSSAGFFFAYELSKNTFNWYLPGVSEVTNLAFASSFAEVFACLLRIPFEVVKQHAQAEMQKIDDVGNAQQQMTSREAFSQVLRKDGFKGFFRGFFSLVFREIPFALIQMPIWEYLKSNVAAISGGPITGFQSGLCGSVAGGIAAALTTPLDVAKTRIILSKSSMGAHEENPFKVMLKIARQEGIMTLFAGIIPRVSWISIGGFIFLGTYDQVKIILSTYA